MTVWSLVIGVVIGMVVGAGAAVWLHRRRLRATGPEKLPADVPHLVQLLRRAYDATAACLVGGDAEPIISLGDPPPPDTLVDRAVSVAESAMDANREIVVREGSVIVAVGDGQVGAAVVLGFGSPGDEVIDAAEADLRRLLAELRVARVRELGVAEVRGGTPDWVAAGSESPEGVGMALCEAIRSETGRATALVLRDPSAGVSAILAVSHGADRRLLGQMISVDSAAGRASAGELPIDAQTPLELFGHKAAERRKRDHQGVAFPLRHGREGVGAVVVFGPTDTLADKVRERVLWYAEDAGPRLGSAARVRAAEVQTLSDAATGLPHRSALEGALRDWTDGPCAVLCVSLDGFDRLTEGFGPPAADAALKRIGRVFRKALREDDVVARVGAGEFAIWLPHTALQHGLEVAERIRSAMDDLTFHWSGADLNFTCSVGVAGVPDSVARASELMAASEEALERARSLGRNRVEVAGKRSA